MAESFYHVQLRPRHRELSTSTSVVTRRAGDRPGRAKRVGHLHAKGISVQHAPVERGEVTGTPVGCACGDGVVSR
jgi:hypothetical protein